MIFRKHEKTEDIIKRKSYYGFAKYYPGKMGTKSSYVIGESRIVKKKERIRRILIGSCLTRNCPNCLISM